MPAKPDELLTLEQAALRLQISTKTLRKYIKAGLIESLALNPLLKRQQRRIKASVLQVYINANSGTLKTPERQKRAYNRSANYKPYARKKPAKKKRVA